MKADLTADQRLSLIESQKKLYLKWIEWALFHSDRNFQITRSGTLCLKYSNLLIFVYPEGEITMMDNKNKEIIFQGIKIEPYRISFFETSVYYEDHYLCNYNTDQRLKYQDYGTENKFKPIF